jgi:hypothetical protein
MSAQNRKSTKEEIQASEKAANELWEKTFNNSIDGPWCIRVDEGFDPDKDEIKFRVQKKVDEVVKKEAGDKKTKIGNMQKK